jgi:hypothetical protein
MKAIVKNGRLMLDEPSDLPEGTEVELGVHSPGTLSPDALGLVEAGLQPAIRAIYRLWEAVDAGETERIAFHREQLMRDLDGLRAGADPLKALASTPVRAIRPQHLSGLELAVFGARLPQPPEGEYRAHGE